MLVFSLEKRTNICSEKKYTKRSSVLLLHLVYFFSEQTLSPTKVKCYVVWFFLQKKRLLSTHQSAIREAPMVFSRLKKLDGS